KIGEGGYGAVYRAEHTLMDREVAIKVLHERRRDEVTQRRFLREARLASRLNHSYAAHVYAWGGRTREPPALDRDGVGAWCHARRLVEVARADATRPARPTHPRYRRGDRPGT